jgi:predicted DCC family thiol-disulfide oxidoreductase YuxK
MVNYFDGDTRPTPVNLAVARAIIVGLILWKIIRYKWRALPTWPTPLRDILPIFRHPIVFQHIDLIAIICAGLLFAVLVGYRLRATALVSAVLVTYLGTVRHAYQISHTSRILFNMALVLVLFAVFAEEDKLTLDQLRRTRTKSMDTLAEHLEGENGQYRHRALKWSLVLIGLFYFQGGYSKLVLGNPFEWVQPWSLGRFIAFRTDGPTYFLSDFLLSYPSLLTAGAVGTLLLEVGFIFAIVLGKRIWPFLIGLAGMHFVIAFSVGPIFTDQLPFLALFLPWDRALGHLQRSDDVVVVYDRDCLFCMRSLHLLRYLDINGTVAYYNQYTVPDRWDRADADFEDAMYAFRGDAVFRGYDAFRELFRQFWVLHPAAGVMSLPGMQHVGDRIYRYIAENRSRHFTCSIDDS